MKPILLDGDVLFFEKIKFSQIKVDDLILLRKKRRFITHRVTYKGKRFLITKGDNSHFSDGRSRASQVFARVYKIQRKNKSFSPSDIYLLQSAQYLEELTSVCDAFRKKAINFTILKGLPLHLYYQRNNPQHLYVDCDILIDYSNKERAQEIIYSLGFKRYDTSFSFLHGILKNKEIEETYIKTNKKWFVNLDIHFEPGFLMHQIGSLESLYPQKLINEMVEEFLFTKREITYKEKLFPILSPTQLIYYLALHFFHHNFQGIHRLQLLKFVLTKEKFYQNHQLQDKILEKASYYKISNFIYPVFLLMVKFYPNVVPKKFLNSISLKSSTERYIKRYVTINNIFDSETRLDEGIIRFKLIFILSQNNIILKYLTFLFPSVLYSILWFGFRRITLFSSFKQKV